MLLDSLMQADDNGGDGGAAGADDRSSRCSTPTAMGTDGDGSGSGGGETAAAATAAAAASTNADGPSHNGNGGNGGENPEFTRAELQKRMQTALAPGAAKAAAAVAVAAAAASDCGVGSGGGDGTSDDEVGVGGSKASPPSRGAAAVARSGKTIGKRRAGKTIFVTEAQAREREREPGLAGAVWLVRAMVAVMILARKPMTDSLKAGGMGGELYHAVRKYNA